jgi:hypothetical protein
MFLAVSLRAGEITMTSDLGQSLRLTSGLVGMFLAALLAPAPVGATNVGRDVTVELVAPHLPNPSPPPTTIAVDDSDTVIVVNPGVEITAGDTTNIGSMDLLGGESIDIGPASITYRVRGNGGTDPVDSNYTLTNFGPGAFFRFSNLEPEIIGVGITLSNVIGVSLGTQVQFGSDNVELFVGTLGVRHVLSGPDLGTITLNLDLAVPEPAPPVALVLGLAGLLALRLLRRHGLSTGAGP